MENNGRIELIIGPMFAGKTSELLRRITRHCYSSKSCLLVKAAKDTRYSSDCVASHDNQKMQATACETLESIKDIVKDYDVVGIDEGQFFPDLNVFAEWAANCGKIVVVAALDGDFRRMPFGGVCELIPMCEVVSKLSAVCMLCHSKDASFTRRICGGTEVEEVGGVDKYVATCRACYHIPITPSGKPIAALMHTDENIRSMPQTPSQTSKQGPPTTPGKKRERSPDSPVMRYVS